MGSPAPLERFASEPGRSAVLLDVDGVLAPIVLRPEDARVPPETVRELDRLARRYALVACITGRPAEDARRVVGTESVVYVGEHGLELDPEAHAWAPRVREFAASAGWPAAELKQLSAAFHYRGHADPVEAERALAELASRAAAEGFRTRWGRKVLEVLPPVEASKGTAVRRLLAEHRLRRALYAGDDTTDLDAFRALDGLELALRVAVASDEGPSELGTAADLVVGGPAELAELLGQL